MGRQQLTKLLITVYIKKMEQRKLKLALFHLFYSNNFEVAVSNHIINYCHSYR
ncbi:hypothetical protein FC89_GL002084 [Liquorilactobacillus ghanensis DSM 18630]|uniref:Uncharacterized protein n=1 Tax=Liquorilactobacillus ghanensis DSM 18630 TaxID=1423750 RepID=A0A0R1VQE2_9LACO|nr:hypothetical protein FC89_GL002084 [Liquorilactobacillus ghanensis DSM 18630]